MNFEAVTADAPVVKKPHLCGLRQTDLAEDLESIGLPASKARYHTRQIFRWVYQRKVNSFDEMTDLSKVVRSHLAEKYSLEALPKVFEQKSIDGTQKFLFKLDDGKTIESVLIPADDRLTICISSQVGCAMGCKFCLTATMGLIRNLKVDEIVRQVFELSRHAGITNIVFMGMGEPLHNLENVARACEILLNQDGLNFSKRKITISTSGLVPQIRKMNERLVGENRVNLAISLNGSYDAQRGEVMPVNKAFPIDDLLDACREFKLEPHRRITFEYVMLGGLNDSVEDAARVMRLLKDIPSKVNLIPFNAHHGSPYQRPTDQAVDAFHRYLLDRGVSAMIRHSRGRDILAACGQLRSAVEEKHAV
ncbi:MAG: 23S rRNA (adenine(2503)-C(2))-methyltransferase RlmN [Bdellovibrionota bacterium]